MQDHLFRHRCHREGRCTGLSHSCMPTLIMGAPQQRVVSLFPHREDFHVTWSKERMPSWDAKFGHDHLCVTTEMAVFSTAKWPYFFGGNQAADYPAVGLPVAKHGVALNIWPLSLERTCVVNLDEVISWSRIEFCSDITVCCFAVLPGFCFVNDYALRV